jgi:phosphonate transport system substrate-binding protein
MAMNKLRLGGFLAGLIVALALQAARAAESTFVLAVVPRGPEAATLRTWQPLLERLSAETGLRLRLQLYSRTHEFEADFRAGGPDFIYCSAYQLIMARRAQGYRPLLRAHAGGFAGLLVVRTDSRVRQLADLAGANIAFPSPNAFVASLYMRALLTGKERIPFRPDYVGTHENVLRSVINDQTAAGGIASDIFADEPEALRAGLRVVYRTPPAPGHTLAVHPRVESRVGRRIMDALLALGRDDQERRLLDAVGLPEATAADFDRDYRPLEDLGLDRFVAP